MGLQINSSSYVAQMKTLIRNTLKKKGKCTVFVCGTNNDDNDSYAAYNCMSLVKTLNYKSSYIKYTHVADCLAGSRGGFLSDDSHYNNATLKKIITKFKKLS